MERHSATRTTRRTWLIRTALLALVASGPQVLSIVVTATAGIVTLPFTGELAIKSNKFEQFNVILLMIYMIAVVGLNFVALPRLLSIGHGALFGLGAYTVAILTTKHHVSFWLALLIAAVLCGVMGLGMGIPALRLGVFALAMVTLGYALVFRDLLYEWHDLSGGGSGISSVEMPAGFDSVTTYYYLVAAVLVVAVVLMATLFRSPTGRQLAAVGERPIAAQALGMSPYRAKLGAFVLSTTIAGVAGGLYGPLLGFVTPDSFLTDLSVLFLLMVLLGGGGSVVGPLIGAVLLFRIPIEVERVSDQPGDVSLLIYGAILLLSVQVFPRGIISAWWWIKARFFTKKDSIAPTAVQRQRSALGGVLTPLEATTEPVLQVTGVRKRLGGVQALNGVDITVRPGVVHALIGPNGAGKTTFLNILSGFVHPDEGSIVFRGEPMPKRPSRRARHGLGRTFQTPQLFDEISSLENVLAALDRHRSASGFEYALRLPRARREEKDSIAKAQRLLVAVGLDHKSDVAAKTLPPGEQRLLEVARMLALNPSVVLMDEPAAGLNDAEIAELEEMIRALTAAGVSILLVEHHMEFVLNISDEITVIDFGAVIAHGTPDEVRRDPAVIAAYLGGGVEAS